MLLSNRFITLLAIVLVGYAVISHNHRENAKTRTRQEASSTQAQQSEEAFATRPMEVLDGNQLIKDWVDSLKDAGKEAKEQAQAYDSGGIATTLSEKGSSELAQSDSLQETHAIIKEQLKHDFVQAFDRVIGQGEAVVEGSLVTIDYVFKSSDGSKSITSFDEGRVPLRFTIGKSEISTLLDRGLLGMKNGGKRIVLLQPYLESDKKDQFPYNAFDSSEKAIIAIVDLIHVRAPS